DEFFTAEKLSSRPLLKGEYENCTFTKCNFSHTKLSSFHFVECTFTDCDLSLAQLEKTILQGVSFINCKMLGLHFYSCNNFGLALSFENCLLTHSSFYHLKIPKTLFKNCLLREVNFIQT